MQIEYDGHSYEVTLDDDGTLDTVLDVEGITIRFSDTAEHRNKHTGAITPAGFQVLALEAIPQAIEEHASEVEHFSENELHDMFDEYIDEVSPVVEIGNLKYTPSHVLKQIDETAYRCGFDDWLDAENINDCAFPGCTAGMVKE